MTWREAQRQAQILRGEGDAEATRSTTRPMASDPKFSTSTGRWRRCARPGRRQHDLRGNAQRRFLPLFRHGNAAGARSRGRRALSPPKMGRQKPEGVDFSAAPWRCKADSLYQQPPLTLPKLEEGVNRAVVMERDLSEPTRGVLCLLGSRRKLPDENVKVRVALRGWRRRIIGYTRRKPNGWSERRH